MGQTDKEIPPVVKKVSLALTSSESRSESETNFQRLPLSVGTPTTVDRPN
jgi:hypothetical protein